MNEVKLVERDGGNCCAQAQADGDPGYTPVVYVDRRGNDQSVARYDDQTNAEFSDEQGLRVCHDCVKWCEPVLIEDPGKHGGTPVHFCYLCDFDGRVRVLVEDGVADLHTVGMIVHRLIAYEIPGAGVDRVTVIR